MSYKAAPKSLRVAYLFQWPSSFLNTKNFKNSIYGNTLYRYIEYYLNSVFYHKITEKSYFNINNNFIAAQGTHSIISFLGGLEVKLNYYLDFRAASKPEIDAVHFKFYEAQLYLTKLLKIKVSLTLHNYYLFIWRYYLYNYCRDRESLKAISLAKQHNEYYVIECAHFQAMRGKLTKFKKNFRRFSKNRYYHRILNPIFALFHHNILDCKIITNIIAKELGLLRKGHKRFLAFLKQVFAYLFKIYSKRKIRGMRLTVKGRITLHNRQTRRKQKKVMTFGFINSSNRYVYLMDEKSLAFNRFGLMNITFSYCFYKKKEIRPFIFGHSLNLNAVLKNNKSKLLTSFQTLKIFRPVPSDRLIAEKRIGSYDVKFYRSYLSLMSFLQNRMYLEHLLYNISNFQKINFSFKYSLKKRHNLSRVRIGLLRLFLTFVNGNYGKKIIKNNIK